jgi:hypothetical protein
MTDMGTGPRLVDLVKILLNVDMTKATIARDDRRATLHEIVGVRPRVGGKNLVVAVSMQVYKTRAYDLSDTVDGRLGCELQIGTDRDNPVVLDRDIGHRSSASIADMDCATSQQQITPWFGDYNRRTKTKQAK